MLDAVVVAEAEARALPDDLDAQERWIDLLLSTGQLERAVAEARARVQRAPASPDAQYLLGRALPAPDASREAFERALRLDPEHARSYAGIGGILRARGALREAAEAYQRALSLDPTLAEAWGGLLAITVASGDREGAGQVAEAALAKVPQHVESWLALAAARPAQAAQVLEQATRAVGWDARVHAARAVQALGADDATTAAAAAREALVRDPSSADAHWLVGLAAERLDGSLDAAGVRALQAARSSPEGRTLRALDALVSSYPRSALARLTRARTLQPTDPAGARADLEAGLAAHPDAIDLVATLGLALRGVDDARAARLLTVAVGARPYDASLAVAATDALLAAGQGEQARALAAEATTLFPFSLPVCLKYVGVLSAQGEHEAAWRAAREAADRIHDPRAALAAAAAAQEAGHLREAAQRYDQLAAQLGKPELAAVAANLRRTADRTP
ncbi:MAG: tetratricopeptide repeat protein [Alphaproteobacteria bacterium]|nr:tetratricopeptide repeat protein [Alphaproteobacteria bacterium]